MYFSHTAHQLVVRVGFWVLRKRSQRTKRERHTSLFFTQSNVHKKHSLVLCISECHVIVNITSTISKCHYPENSNQSPLERKPSEVYFVNKDLFTNGSRLNLSTLNWRPTNTELESGNLDTPQKT